MNVDAPSTWRAVCRDEGLPTERGVAALLAEGQVAIVRMSDGTLYCVGHRDPFGGANVIARGLVGSTTIDGVRVPTVASPMYKQVFDLRDGSCLSEPGVTLGSWEVRSRDGNIEVGRCVAEPTGCRDE
ncbi:nitrite reductase small subunit NirD [Cumulibacter soli]|uniref:nitrite reductase small subunit NirD n=1 Tax=Cumulibacter soli TaxID=2546344 RepID=UPI0010685DE8|nr:nitrite reductase small subunit NirD [Cumulibacter soli]